jgi:hypothetical protein
MCHNKTSNDDKTEMLAAIPFFPVSNGWLKAHYNMDEGKRGMSVKLVRSEKVIPLKG